MSMENAILELAAAQREQAAAIREVAAMMLGMRIAGVPQDIKSVSGMTSTLGGDTLLQDKAAELAAATEQRAAAAREAQKKDQTEVKAYGDMTEEEKIAYEENDKRMAKEIAEKRAVEVVKAVSDEIEEKGTVSPDIGELDQCPLDYAKDVRPVLLAAIKKVGKDSVAAMLKTYGVEKADKLAPEQLPAVLAEAQKLAA